MLPVGGRKQDQSPRWPLNLGGEAYWRPPRATAGEASREWSDKSVRMPKYGSQLSGVQRPAPASASESSVTGSNSLSLPLVESLMLPSSSLPSSWLSSSFFALFLLARSEILRQG